MKAETRARVATTNAEIDAGIARAKVSEKYRPKAVAAAYQKKNDSLEIVLATGVTLAIPRRLLEGLENASPGDVAKVTIEDHGSSLHWETLDVDHYVPGLIDGVFGTRKWMAAMGAKGGAVSSPAKRAAARKNGSKGGRPLTVAEARRAD
jgi:hypothetical protein